MKTRTIVCSIAILMLFICETATSAPKPKKELYIPMDYSACGYHASEQPIPDVTTVIKIERQEGDCSRLIQQAIDYLASQKADKNGHRGAILLGEGVFRIDRPLRISTQGIVLRGSGRNKTTIIKHGVERGAAIYIESKEQISATNIKPDTLYLKEQKTQAGSTTLILPAGGMKAGERIRIVRPSTKEWILSLKMNDFGGGLDYTGWKPTDIDITWDRTVTKADGNTITIDAPITTTLTAESGNAYIVRNPQINEITECGVENLTIQSEVNSWNPKDEDHCWDGIYVNNARDCWVRNVGFIHLAGSAVNLQKNVSRVTVEDCIAEKPVSEIGGWRRQTFLTRGQQTLFQRCISRNGIHDFAAGFCAAGPNAFVQCEGEESLGFSGSIGSWAAGLLFDIVNIDGNDIRFANLEQFQMGTGWNTANSMLWQCTASTIECYSPDSDNRSSAHGCWGTLTGNGEWTSSNDHVSPRSLFYDQLEKRLGKLPLNPYILPRATNATSSPTVEQAMELAQESLTQPRLTLEMWIDSVQAKSTQPQSQLTEKWKKHPIPAETYEPSDIIVRNSLITSSTKGLITGNQYNIPWWSGRVKDNFIEKEAKPAITRFVPGREGNGWTDRIDSVVSYLDQNHYSMLYHHYGLWYDLRRTDHERVRRADGDVWPPFYEQPFTRSGEGTAWDGLSRYDLTKPNCWYWQRLNEFATKAASRNILLFNQHYFQHNILEAGAHWVDCPWRNTNNINGTDFPEPVPFAGDKRIFVAEQFYNKQNPTLRSLHKQYIRMCLEQLKDQPNVVHSISAEYTGPLHFTRFWLETIAEWEAETGKHPLIALSCTKDVQDSILADPKLNKVVDIIDIRYWHYNTAGLWAPAGGKNMAPRQWMRKMKVGKTAFNEAYRAVREMREQYPGKAVVFSSQQYPSYGWAILMAGGSLPNIPLSAKDSPLAAQLLSDLSAMSPMSAEGAVALGDSSSGYLIYTTSGQFKLQDITPGKYTVYTVHPQTGAIKISEKSIRIDGSLVKNDIKSNQIFWIRKQ
ncbi:MAG: pectate lyase [Prevotella sp.]|nr:pectate lyase [Prevotella sp.]